MSSTEGGAGAQGGSRHENGISSVKYYSLTDENVRKFYDEWRFKTMAIIRKKGWESPFAYDKTLPIPTRDEVEVDATATAKEKEIYKSNLEAYDQVLMGCSGIPLGIVQRAKGDVRVAIELLDEKYAQNDVSNLTDLIQRFTSCKLDDTDTDPDSWFVKIDKINAKLVSIGAKYEKKEYELKAHLLGNLPEGYEDVKTKIHGNEDNYSVRQIEKEIVNKWTRDFHKDESEKKGIAMTVTTKGNGNWKKFKGTCRKCGKIGHKALDCRSEGGNNNKSKGVKCYGCGQEGHYKRDCPKKDEKTPDEIQTGMFVGMLWCHSIDKEGPEDDEDESGDEEVERFLTDSGATVHVVDNNRCMVNLKNIDERLTVGDKSEMRATQEGTLFLQTEDKVTFRLDKVKVVPGIAKSIISIGLLIDAGNKVEMSKSTMLITNPHGNKILVERRESPLFYLRAKRKKVTNDVFTVKEKKDDRKKIDINDAHELFGHVSEGPLKALLKQRNYEVVGTRKTCDAWADWHGSQEIPLSLKMFAKDMEVDLTNDSIGEVPYSLL
jgi:hypothetical protein